MGSESTGCSGSAYLYLSSANANGTLSKFTSQIFVGPAPSGSNSGVWVGGVAGSGDQYCAGRRQVCRCNGRWLGLRLQLHGELNASGQSILPALPRCSAIVCAKTALLSESARCGKLPGMALGEHRERATAYRKSYQFRARSPDLGSMAWHGTNGARSSWGVKS